MPHRPGHLVGQNPEFRLGVRRGAAPVTTATRMRGVGRQLQGVQQLRRDITQGPLMQGIQQQALQNLQQPGQAFAQARTGQLATQLGALSQAQGQNIQQLEERLGARGRGRSGLALTGVQDLERARISAQAGMVTQASRDIAVRQQADERAALQQALQTLTTLSGVEAQQRRPQQGVPTTLTGLSGALTFGRPGGGAGAQPQLPEMPPFTEEGRRVGPPEGLTIPGMPPGIQPPGGAQMPQAPLPGAVGSVPTGPAPFGGGVGSIPQFGGPAPSGVGVGSVPPGFLPQPTGAPITSLEDLEQSIWG